MYKVIITPTTETSWGIEDKYNIKLSDETNALLYENVPQKSLEGIIKNNKYEVVGGEKYL